MRLNVNKPGEHWQIIVADELFTVAIVLHEDSK